MILDKLTEFSDRQSIVGAVGTILSAKSVDTGPPGTDAGIGEPVFVVVRPTTVVTSGGAATIDVQVQTSDDPAFAGAVVVGSSGPVPFADFKNVVQRLPRRCKRYVRLAYVIAGAATTGGAVDANLAKDADGVVALDTAWKY